MNCSVCLWFAHLLNSNFKESLTCIVYGATFDLEFHFSFVVVMSVWVVPPLQT